MPTNLYLPLEPALRLAEHVLASPEHEQSLSEHLGGSACPGALVWVVDDGTYLMSSGIPSLKDPDDHAKNAVVYAHGFGPGTPSRGSTPPRSASTTSPSTCTLPTTNHP